MIAKIIVSAVDCKWKDTNKVANSDPTYVDVNGKRSFENVCLIWLIGPNRKAKLDVVSTRSVDMIR